ncbi:uncharacterized protein B0P05DRAFT_637264 [Gilbertella persicaria]|uniref:uncharacterized protein n=1 Tax=Gilbertella persicaria TaxID=101096 RepID=UPI00221FFFEC|nr:uncharacterized protein B0P05DRAFT_637264 [Gilbertella persicaria]KAI8079492.1 hypothetical protein B0P05DRAFT_637264 [Gilbertella persicaria]
MSHPLNNQTNHLKQTQPWKKPVLSRSVTRDLDKLKLTSKENDPPNNDYPHLSPTEFQARKKKFATFRFFLDIADPNMKKRIERKIKLLGAAQDPFFSNKCTHLITTKPIPIQDNMLQPSFNDTSAATKKPSIDNVPRDSIVEKAIQWNLVLWSAEVMQKTVDYFVDTQRGRKEPAQEKKALLNALQEEKIFGPSTGANSEAQAKRPQFVPFTGHFLIIEDATQVHRPPVIRHYTKEVITKKMYDYPWPFLKHTAGIRSPFGKRAPPASSKKPEEPAIVMQEQKPVSTTPVVGVNSTTPNHTSTPPPTASSTPHSSQPKLQHPDSYSLRASGFQPCTNTNNHVMSTTTRLQENRRLPPGESVNRLDKRMVENVAQKALHKQAIKGEREEKARKEREQQKKKKDSRYCENCNMLFGNLEEHMKEQTHQTFIRDQNNFKELDAVLEKTHRVYKEPLPDRMKPLIDPNIDGKSVKFQSDFKRPHPTSPSMDSPSKLTTSMMHQKNNGLLLNEPEVVADDKQGWGQYHSVFL